MERSMPFRISGYSEIGESHINWGKSCEDSIAIGSDPDTGVSACVVSDGAGSCMFAKDGSEITANTALRILLRQFGTLYEMPDAQLADTILQGILSPLEERAQMLGCEIGELSATLVCAAMAPDGRWLWFHVGDGVVAACTEDGTCRVLSQYQHVIARNFTTFVTIPDTEYHIGRGTGGIASFLLTSDGSEYLMTFEDGWMTAQAELLLQMSVFFPPARMEDELRQLTAYYKELGMYDDASYVLLADRRYAPQVFSGMDQVLRNLIFYLPEQIPKRAEAQYCRCLSVLTAHPEGVPERQMLRVLRTHKKWNTFRKMLGFLTAGAVSLYEGRYYF